MRLGGGMRKCKKAYGTRDWRRRGGIYRGMKRVTRVQGDATRGEKRGGEGQEQGI